MLGLISSFVAQIAGAAVIQRFMSSKAAIAGAGVLALFIAYEAGNVRGYSRATDLCKAAEIRAELRAAKTDLDIQRNTAEAAQRERDALATAAADLQEKVSAYEEELRKRPAASCNLSRDDVRRLRQLAR